MGFHLQSPYSPAGDQPQAITELVAGLRAGEAHQTLLGVTGSGKTFTIANVLAEWGRPALVISHTKTLAAQLYGEFKQFFPEDGVGYFVSYYDYYQPEAYVPSTNTYIAKDASINDDIDRLRLQATSMLLERENVVIVASVSCLYGLGTPEDWKGMRIDMRDATAPDHGLGAHHRRHRPAPAPGHVHAARARERGDRGERVVPLRAGHARGLEGHAHRHARRHRARPWPRRASPTTSTGSGSRPRPCCSSARTW